MSSAAQQACDRSQKAMDSARLRMTKEGVRFPVRHEKESHDEFYERCQAYSARETQYYIEFLQGYSQSMKPAETKAPINYKEWKAYEDD
jgi:hypothetical protein